MRRFKLPFSIRLERKYDEISFDTFFEDWNAEKGNRQNRVISIDNALHVELGKFKTYNLSLSELIDMGMRYALNKREFQKIMAQLIELKQTKKTE